jgi:site-specific recombinase XerD
MNTLTEAIEDYVRLRHDLAFKLAQTERLLHDFASFMENQEAPFITIEQALQWATSPAHAHPAYWAKRLSAIRLFARYRSATDPRTELPPNGLRPYQPKRAKPYLYTEQDIDRLITQRQVSPNTIASYRDTFRLFLQFAQKRLKKCPSDLAFADVDVTLVEAYLDDLENSRGLSARSRNLRLSAIRSFFCYAA